MAPRKNTQSSEDSLSGGTPEQAEERSTAAGTTTVQQLTGGGVDGDAGAAAGQDTQGAPMEAASALMQAIASIDTNTAKIMPEGSQVAFMAERRVATVASTIEHSGYHFAPDDPIPLTQTEFAGLKETGALVEAAWEDLELLEDL